MPIKQLAVAVVSSSNGPSPLHFCIRRWQEESKAFNSVNHLNKSGKHKVFYFINFSTMYFFLSNQVSSNVAS